MNDNTKVFEEDKGISFAGNYFQNLKPWFLFFLAVIVLAECRMSTAFSPLIFLCEVICVGLISGLIALHGTRVEFVNIEFRNDGIWLLSPMHLRFRRGRKRFVAYYECVLVETTYWRIRNIQTLVIKKGKRQVYWIDDVIWSKGYRGIREEFIRRLPKGQYFLLDADH